MPGSLSRSRLVRFPLAHWRGELPLYPSVLITLFGARVALSGLGGIPDLTLDGLVLLWQVVGCLRSLRRHLADRPDLFATLVTLGGILAALPLMGLSHLDRLSASRIAALPPPPPAGGDPGVRLIATRAVLEGPMDFPMFTALKAALAANPEIGELELDSDGGRVFAARAMARLVRENRLDTRVARRCASACTLVFMAGKTRRLGPGGRLGFHGYRQQVNIDTVDPDAEEQRDIAAFLAAGIDAGFTARAFGTDPADIWFPSRAELIAAGVIAAEITAR